MMQNIHSFPTPFSDEFFGGVILRYHERFGGGSLRETLYAKLNLGRSAVVGVPTALNNFILRTRPVWENGISTVVDEHTAWPFYRPFLSRHCLLRGWRQITVGPSGALQLTLGTSASRLHLAPRLQACSRCVNDDLVAVGYPYLHVDHQLPGIRACHIHGLMLQALPLSDLFGGQSLAFALHAISDSTAVASSAEIALSDLARAARVARIERLYSRHVQTAYRERLRALRLITPRHRIRHEETAMLIQRQFPTGLLLRIGAAPATLSRWVHDIVDRPGRTHHPVKHLVLIGALFGDFASFLAEIRQREFDFDSNPTAVRPKSVKTAVRVLMRGKRATATSVAASVGISVTTCVTYAKEMGLPVVTKPKRIDAKVCADIELRIARGESVVNVAQAANVSVPTVYRVLRSSPDVVKRRAAQALAKNRAWRRSEWRAVIARDPSRGVAVLRRRSPATYAWLYRHDKQWLRENPSRYDE